jgi:phosphoenolpyruvate carboxykinase (GTP)
MKMDAEPNQHVKAWVDEMARMVKPDRVYWCDGSEEEKKRLTADSFKTGDFIELNQKKLPGCLFHRSAQNDVARTEHLTFICTPTKQEAGPTNNWMAPEEAYKKLGAIFDGSYKGRTMYVMPFIMGQPGSSFSKVAVQLTDSLYVVLSMRIMTRMGTAVWKQLGSSNDFTRCLHGKADLSMDHRFICHFPQDNTIWSVGSGYGGNALLGKKCLSVRIASYQGRKEGWMAEHMLIAGIENPQGEVRYIAAAFPSACGKTNLAMLVPPPAMKGWKVWTIGDDIAWLRIGADGRLWAINPENGFFGVAPGTNMKSNPNAMKTVSHDSLYTNVALKDDGTVWWEGHDDPAPAHAVDWKGQNWTPASKEPAAHPNSRFTAPAANCPVISPHWQDPQGVPIDAIIFGGRRPRMVPLVYEARSWQHGVFVGATMASERTAAQLGKLGEVRRDPMAMLPFCGYDMADYWQHWLTMGRKIPKPPKIFHVNWFRQDEQGKFLWPGFGENLRVIEWILGRCTGKARAVETPVGYMPSPADINTQGLDVDPAVMKHLLTIQPAEWKDEIASQGEFLAKFQNIPVEVKSEYEGLTKRMGV